MNFILLAIIILGVSSQTILSKTYNTKFSGKVFIYVSASSLFSTLVFLITANGKFDFKPEILIYSVAFAACFCAANVFFVLSINNGPLSLSALINQYSPVIPTLYGLLILAEPLKATLLMGIALLLISLFLINCEKKGGEKKITLKWIIGMGEYYS